MAGCCLRTDVVLGDLSRLPLDSAARGKVKGTQAVTEVLFLWLKFALMAQVF